MTRISKKVHVVRQDSPVEGHDVRPPADAVVEDDHDCSNLSGPATPPCLFEEIPPGHECISDKDLRSPGSTIAPVRRLLGSENRCQKRQITAEKTGPACALSRAAQENDAMPLERGAELPRPPVIGIYT